MDPSHRRIKILWGSPLPPTRSGVSDYTYELMPELRELADVRLLRPPGWSPPEGWPVDLETVPADTQASAGEITVLHLGNNPHHVWLAERQVDHRVAVVLHDAVLHHLLVEATEARGAHDVYADCLTASHGDAGSVLATARRVGYHGRLDPFLFPARTSFIDGAGAVVVHSRWAWSQVLSELPDIPVERIGLPVADPGSPDRERQRHLLGVEAGDVVLMHLGFLTPEKGLAEVVSGASAAAAVGVPIRLVVVGEGEERSRILRDAASAAGIGDRLVTTGWVEPASFPQLPAAADLGVVVRTPSAGETSAAAVRFLACGTPVAVGANRQFLEWPPQAAPRLTPGPSCAAELARVLASVGSGDWHERRAAARRVYEQCHRPEIVARELVDFLARVF